jgi:LEA14-like dessication related protein
MKKSRPRGLAAAALAALALAGSACGAKAPILAIDGLKVGDMGITGVAVDVRFRVRNPNPDSLSIERLEYELFLNGNRLGRGFESSGLQLAGFGEGKITSRFDVNFLSLPGTVKDLLRDDSVQARVKGYFYTSGNRRLGFSSDAKVNLHDR